MNGKNLKEKLQADGVNLSALARKMGYATDQNLHSVLGAKDVRSGLIEDLAKVLNKPIGWFYEEEASSTPEDNGVVACEANAPASNVGTPATRENDLLAMCDALRNDIEYLKKLLDEERKRSAQYWEMIQKLMTKWNLGI